VSTGKGRHCLFEADEWKTFAAERLLTEPGGGGCIRLFGDDPRAHEMFAQQLTCEIGTPANYDGRSFDKWLKKPGRDDNHWWDCFVGHLVAASVAGLAFSATGRPEPPKQSAPRKKWSEMQAEKMAGRNR
jgi:hypothetical protein